MKLKEARLEKRKTRRRSVPVPFATKSFLPGELLYYLIPIISINKRVILSKFNFNFNLISHRKNMIGHLYAHRKPFCEVCRQYFQNEDIYKSHNKSRHNGGPEVCFVCHAVFKDRNKLVSHLRVHKNANTYRCSVPGCTEAFKSKVDSIAHLRKCPFLGSCSSISISSPTHQPSSDEDGDGKAQHNSKSR